MKTTFSRQFVMIAVLLLVCMLITGVSFRFLMLNSIETEQRGTLQSDAAAVANLARPTTPQASSRTTGTSA